MGSTLGFDASGRRLSEGQFDLGPEPAFSPDADAGPIISFPPARDHNDPRNSSGIPTVGPSQISPATSSRGAARKLGASSYTRKRLSLSLCRYPPRHPPRFRPSFLELHGIT